MALTKEQKKKIIEELKEIVSKHKAMIFVDFKGLDNKSLMQLRDELKAAQSQMRVCKKPCLVLLLKKKKRSLICLILRGRRPLFTA